MQSILQWVKKNKRGAAMIEYAVILAFVAGVGATFLDGNMSGSINSIIKNVASLLGMETSGGNLLTSEGTFWHKYIMGGQYYKAEGAIKDTVDRWTGDYNYRCSILGEDGTPIPLEDNTTYRLVVDLDKLPEALKSEQALYDTKACVFVWDDNTKQTVINTGDMHFSDHSNNENNRFTIENNTATYEFTTGTNNKFGMNLVIAQRSENEATIAAIEQYQDFMRLEKVNK